MQQDHLEEEILSREVVFSGRVFEVEVRRVRLPDGREARRDIVRHAGAVAMIPVTGDGRVLLVRQFRSPAGEALLEIPAGTLEPGEDPLACAARELEEEIGYRAGRLEPLFSSYLAPGYSSEMLHTFLATDLQPTAPHRESDEIIRVEAISLAEAPALIRNGSIKDAKTICGLLLAAQRLHEEAPPAIGGPAGA